MNKITQKSVSAIAIAMMLFSAAPAFALSGSNNHFNLPTSGNTNQACTNINDVSVTTSGTDANAPAHINVAFTGVNCLAKDRRVVDLKVVITNPFTEEVVVNKDESSLYSADFLNTITPGTQNFSASYDNVMFGNVENSVPVYVVQIYAIDPKDGKTVEISQWSVQVPFSADSGQGTIVQFTSKP